MRSFKKPGKGHSGSQRNGFSKCAAFQFLEILQVAFLELLQDLTKVYSSCLEEEADQLLFFFLPLQWEASRSCSQSGQWDMCSEWNENIGHCHLLVGLSQYQQNEVQWCIFSFSFFGTPLCFKATCEDLYLCNHVTIRGGTLLALYVPLLNFLWNWRTRWGAVINSLHVPLHKWNGIETQVQPEMKAKWDRLPFIWKGVCLNEGNAPLKIQSK